MKYVAPKAVALELALADVVLTSPEALPEIECTGDQLPFEWTC